MVNIFRALVRAAAIAIVFCACNLMAATVQVGTCKSLPTYPTIQQAINSVPIGSTIYICPGDYPEQLSITKKINLKGVTQTTAGVVSIPTIKSPAGGLIANTTSLISGA